MADMLTLRKFEALSPFEIKDELIKLAKTTSRTTQSAFLNAGRGNPNWVATKPREAYFLLGQFAVTECKRVMEHPAGIGGMPQAKGIADRLDGWLAKQSEMPGAAFLSSMVKFATKTFGFDRDAFVHELVIRSSATTIRFPIGCWSTTSGSRRNICCGRCAAIRVRPASSTFMRSRAALLRCATSSNR